MAARPDERVVRSAIGAPHRRPGQIDAVEDVGVDELRREVEGDDVEPVRGLVGVDREQGHAPLPHERFHVAPGGVGAFGDCVRPLVQYLVEDLEPLVGQSHLVGVRVDEKPGCLVRTVHRRLGPVFAPDVAGGLLHLGQERFYPRPKRRHVWGPVYPGGAQSPVWRPTGQLRPVPPRPQYPFGFLARYCWW